MIYFCCGMVRSGSTWQYNIVKSLLEKREIARPYGNGFIPNESTLNEMIKENGNYFVKIHTAYGPDIEEINKGKARAIYIHRDLRDVAASFMVRHNRNLKWVIDNDLLLKASRNYKRWTSVSDVLIQQYEKVMSDMPAAIAEIAAFLKVEFLPGELEELSEKFSMEKQKKVIQNIPGSSGTAKFIRKLRRRIGNVLHTAIGKEKTLKIARYFGKTGIGGVDADTLLLSEHINTGEVGSYKKVMGKREKQKLEQHINSLNHKGG